MEDWVKTEKYGAGEECLSAASLHEIRRRCMHLSARICLLMLSQVRFRSFHLIKVWDYMEAAPLPSLPSSSFPFLLVYLCFFFFSLVSFSFFLFFFFRLFSFLFCLYLFTRSFLSLSLAIPNANRFVLNLYILYFDSYPNWYPSTSSLIFSLIQCDSFQRVFLLTNTHANFWITATCYSFFS